MNTFLQLLNRVNSRVLFFGLLFVSLFLIVRNNEAQGKIFLNSAGRVTGFFGSGATAIGSYFNLRRENEKLQHEISVLRGQLAKDQYNTQVNIDTLQRVLDSTRIQIYKYIEATVVNNSVDKPKNYLTLNRGRHHGVKENMGVITADGVLGVVRYVSKYYCIVMSVLHTDSRVSAQIRGVDKGFYGSLVWRGKDPRFMQLIDIPKHNKISAKEDVVETTGFSTYYPPGVTIGKVFYHSIPPGSSNHLIQVKLNTNMANVRYAQIVVNVHADEINQLEARAKDEQ
jgi:rod shape-determining protein MreC